MLKKAINLLLFTCCYIVDKSTPMKIVVRDTTVAALEPSYGLAGGAVTPSGETSVKLSLVKKVLTGVPRALA